jgi:hypothetical protein
MKTHEIAQVSADAALKARGRGFLIATESPSYRPTDLLAQARNSQGVKSPLVTPIPQKA